MKSGLIFAYSRQAPSQLSVYRKFRTSSQTGTCLPLVVMMMENWSCLPWLSVEVLFMSPEMKEDSDCFLTVSFHIRLMRLCVERKKTATD